MKKFVSLLVVLATVLSLSACGGGRSSSGRTWSDLSEVEKANARWAYEVQQGLKGK